MKNKFVWLFISLVVVYILGSTIVRGSVIYPVYEKGHVFLLERVFREDHSGNIIGNPDFKPTFDHVDKDVFLELLHTTRDHLGYEFIISEKLESQGKTFAYEVLIENEIVLKYSEGFIIMSLEEYDNNEALFYKTLKTVCYTLSPEEDIEAFPEYHLMDKFQSYNEHFYPGMIDYRFYHEEDYEVHIEDMKMGH